MSLEDWQISLISATVGTSIPLIFILIREWHTERKRKSEIRNVLHAELVLAHEVLAQAVEGGSKRDASTLFVEGSLDVYESFPLDTTYYDSMPIEVLAKSVDIETLKSLQKTYNVIYLYNNRLTRVIGGLILSKNGTKNLISQIESTAKLLSDCK